MEAFVRLRILYHMTKRLPVREDKKECEENRVSFITVSFVRKYSTRTVLIPVNKNAPEGALAIHSM